jgi:RHS repeat-associated protein
VGHLGTPRLVCDRCKDRKAEHDYYAFGLEASDPTQDAEPTRFTSQETDLQNTSGQTDDLVNMHARFYHPILARFLSADLLSGNPHSPQSFNLFAYVRGNPVNYWDPYGMDEVQDPFHLARFYDETWVVGLDPWREAAEGWLSRDVFFFGIPTFDGGGSIMERLARQPRVPTMDDLLKQVTHVIECKETIGQLWAKNFAVTNQATIRMMFGGSSGRKISSSLRTGLGIAGGGTVADTFQLTTPFRWMAGGFRGMSLGGAEFTGVETGILAGTNSVITYGSVLLAYEGGVAVGSLVSVTFFGNCTDVAP